MPEKEKNKTSEKKRKSIYDKPLKDINKDGKTGFGDTWLGDALGFDGKVGIQKGRPGLKDSLKGARRGSDEKKKESGSKRPQSRPAKAKTKPSERLDTKGETPRESKGGRARYRGRGSKTTDAGMDEKAKRTQSSRTPPTPKSDSDKKAPSGVSYAEWKKMTRAERKAKGLPETTLGWQNQRIMGYGGGNKPKPKSKPTPSTSKPTGGAHPTAQRASGMSRGGMSTNKEGRYQQNGGRDMKKTGMFYDSKSPRGYK